MTATTDLPFSVRQAVALEVLDGLLRVARTKLAKASTDATVRRREALRDERLPAFEAEIAAYFAGFAERNLPGLVIEKALSVFPDPATFDWDRESVLLRQLIGRWYLEMGEAAYGDVGLTLGLDLAFDIEQPALGPVLDVLAERVKGITEVSRETIAARVASAHELGESVDDLERSLGRVFSSWTTSRAHMVALTETATAYNLASLAGYRQSGLVDEVEIFDGADCGWTSHDDPDKAHGSHRTLDEAQQQPIAHPHCQRAWAPVPARAVALAAKP